jgi:hypothetical protein
MSRCVRGGDAKLRSASSRRVASLSSARTHRFFLVRIISLQASSSPARSSPPAPTMGKAPYAECVNSSLANMPATMLAFASNAVPYRLVLDALASSAAGSTAIEKMRLHIDS